MNKITLLPGKPFTGAALGDAPQGAIRNSTGSNTHVIEKMPVECKKVFADDFEDRWLEYVPTTYKPGSKVPLVIACHGGGVNAEVQRDETSWIYIAELEGLIVVFPDAGTNHAWLSKGDRANMAKQLFAETEDGIIDADGHDLKFICGLIEEMKTKYDVDPGRVYMQGMSMGDMMTMQFSRLHGDLLAGADNTAGPSPVKMLFTEDGKIKHYKCPLPIYQARGELDAGVIAEGYKPGLTRQEANAINRNFWRQVNACDADPVISIRDVNNLAFYTGKKANMVYRDVKYRDHGQTFDDAQWAWYTLFSGTRRNEDGTISMSGTLDQTRGDIGAAALAVDCGSAYINNIKIPLSGKPYFGGVKHFDAKERALVDFMKVFYAPISFIPMFFDATVETSADGRTATIITKAGERYTVTESSIGCIHNNRIHSMICQADVKDGQLYLPLKWFATNVFGKFVTECDGAIYIADYFGEMTKDMSVILHEILN